MGAPSEEGRGNIFRRDTPVKSDLMRLEATIPIEMKFQRKLERQNVGNRVKPKVAVPPSSPRVREEPRSVI